MAAPEIAYDAKWGRFFDWASTSPLSQVAAAARADHIRRNACAADPTAFQSVETAGLGPLRVLLSRLVGARRDDTIVLSRSVAELLSILAAGLPLTPPRDTVVLAEPNHPTAALAWLGAARRRSLHIVTVPACSDGSCDLDAIRAAVDSRCVAIVATHVCHLCGTIQPIADLADIAHRVDALLIVDGAQAVGRTTVDVERSGCDLYVGAGRKSMRAPLGTAFLAGPAGLLAAVEPIFWSTRSAQVTASGQGNLQLADVPTRLEANLPDLSALAALAASAREILATGVTTLERHVRSLLPALDRLPGFDSTPGAADRRNNAGIVRYALPAGVSGLDLKAALLREGFVVAADERTIRISIHLPNAAEDLETLVERAGNYVTTD